MLVESWGSNGARMRMDRRVGVVVVVKITLEVWEGLSCVPPPRALNVIGQGNANELFGGRVICDEIHAAQS